LFSISPSIAFGNVTGIGIGIGIGVGVGVGASEGTNFELCTYRLNSQYLNFSIFQHLKLNET